MLLKKVTGFYLGIEIAALSCKRRKFTKMIAELLERKPMHGGIGGSMHLTDISSGFWAQHRLLRALFNCVRCDVSNEEIKQNCHRFGDGAMETGVIHESLNIAALKSLPVLLFVKIIFILFILQFLLDKLRAVIQA